MTSTPQQPTFGDLSQIHFMPGINWLNDPNGLTFHDGVYHLYYQYNPEGYDHGNMSWGHATSPDLVNWEEHPVALSYREEAEIYSGSAVWDGDDTAGFGPALVSFYTEHSSVRRHQVQSIAFSHDDGLTWTDYEGNPVLDRDSGDFRDPKVLRYRGPEGEYWVMAAVEAVAQLVVLYRSDNLRDWELLSEFAAPEVGEGIWECPDLFPLMVNGEQKWVLIISLGMAPVVGGFGTLYFIGSFDGTTFVAEGDFRRLDHGQDNYAGVSFFGLPDDERTMIAWMSNWIYARELPFNEDEPRRGAMTLARKLSLVDVDGTILLRQVPVMTESEVVGEATRVGASDPVRLPIAVPSCCRIDLELELGEAEGALVRFRHGEEGEDGVVLSYSRSTGEVSLDRSAAGRNFPSNFRVLQKMPITDGPKVSMTLWTDLTSVEVFADDGTATLTSLVDVPNGDGLTVEGVDGEVTFSVTVSVPAS